MAVAKRQGTEKPVKIEQRKGLRTRVRTLEQTALLANPIYTEQGKKKKHIERVAKGLGFSLSLPAPSVRRGLSSPLPVSLGRHALTP